MRNGHPGTRGGRPSRKSRAGGRVGRHGKQLAAGDHGLRNDQDGGGGGATKFRDVGTGVPVTMGAASWSSLRSDDNNGSGGGGGGSGD